MMHRKYLLSHGMMFSSCLLGQFIKCLVLFSCSQSKPNFHNSEEEEREAERSIHVIAMERSRGSVLGMTFDTNFDLDDDGDNGTDFGGGEDFGGEGEFAPDTGSFGGGEGEFSPDFGSSIGGGEDSQPGTFVDARSYNNTKVLLDALCNGDAFYEGGSGGNSDYAFFDFKPQDLPSRQR